MVSVWLQDYLTHCVLQDNDEPLPDDELPEWKKEPPKIDLSKINPNDPESMLQATKKGKTLMMFVSVSGRFVHACVQV